MQLIPVLDVRGGIVVRGVAGERARYRPVASCLTSSTDPLEVAESLRDTFGPLPLYVADLDGLEQSRPDEDLHARLVAEGFELMLDCGIRCAAEVERAFESGVRKVIIALETWSDASALRSLVAEAGADRLIFSLDLKGGTPIVNAGEWAGVPAATIAQEVAEAGVRSLIVLDLAAVGVDQGVPTLPLCCEIRTAVPDVKLITGGGVRGRGDLLKLAAAGIDGVLVASALHDGRITARDVAAVQLQPPAG